jgi:hypothetical protein
MMSEKESSVAPAATATATATASFVSTCLFGKVITERALVSLSLPHLTLARPHSLLSLLCIQPPNYLSFQVTQNHLQPDVYDH